MTGTSAEVRGSLPLLGYRTPGTRVEWLDAVPQLPGRVATDVAGLVGIAERGPLHLAVRTTSWTSYTGVFGGHLEQAYLPDAVDTRADIVAAASGDDDDNLVICQMAKHHFDLPRTIARV